MRVDRHRLESRALHGNPLGDPAVRDLLVLVPPGYDASSDRRYPVLYGLAGFASLGASFLNRGCFEEALDQRAARLFAGGCPPALIALPDGATRLGGSQYVNSPTLGRYADHVAGEVVDFVDRRYRTLARPSGRALFGKSSGGFGALHLALEFPGLFGAVACHSGDLGFELCCPPDFPVAAGELARAGGVAPFLDRFFDLTGRGQKIAPAAFTTISVLALAAAYSPDATAPGKFALPFELATAELVPDVFARWLAFDPVRRVAAGAASLRALRLLFVDCGLRDEHQLHFGARRFVNECRAHSVAIEHQEFDDGHRGTSYRYDVSLPKLIAALEPAAER